MRLAPKITPTFTSLIRYVILNHYFFIAVGLLVPRCRVRCRVLAQVTAVPCIAFYMPGLFFPIIDWSFSPPTDNGPRNVWVLRFFHFLVMVSFFILFP